MRVQSAPPDYRLPKLSNAALQQHADEIERALQARFVAQQTAQAPTDEETEVLAQLLGDALCRAHGELVASLQTGEPAVIMHHRSLVADLFEEMLELTYADREGATEDRLPPDHPHREAKSRRQGWGRGGRPRP